jgi:hypothetical protein
MRGTAGAATWLENGTYLMVGPDEIGGTRESASADRPPTPDGFPIPLQWNRLDARLPLGLATDALVTDLEAVGGRPDRDLLWRPVAAVGADPTAPALLIAEGVRAELLHVGRSGRRASNRGADVRVAYLL